MDLRGLGLAAVALVGTAAVVRQRTEANRVRRGTLARLGPDGGPGDATTGPVHTAVAAWQPGRPSSVWGRAAAAVWAAPLTVAGTTAAAAGAAAPRWDAGRGCLVARGVGGPAGAFIGAQGADAATVGQVVLCRSRAPSAALLDHEALHVRQQERLGLLFALAYPAAQARWGYRANPFEHAARRAVVRPTAA